MGTMGPQTYVVKGFYGKKLGFLGGQNMPKPLFFMILEAHGIYSPPVRHLRMKQKT